MFESRKQVVEFQSARVFVLQSSFRASICAEVCVDMVLCFYVCVLLLLFFLKDMHKSLGFVIVPLASSCGEERPNFCSEVSGGDDEGMMVGIEL